MRKTQVLILLGWLVLLSLSVQAQQMDFSVTNIHPKDALLQLSQQSGKDIAFSSNFFKKDQKISLDLKGASLDEIISQILEGSNVAYKHQDGRVVLYKDKPATATVSGYLEDQQSGERLFAATVYSPQYQKGVATNEYGFYSLTLPIGEVELEIDYLGYERSVVKIDLEEDIHHNVGLETSLTIKETVIQAEDEENERLPAEELQVLQINSAYIKATPGVGGEEDLVRAATLLPGVQAGTDGFGGVQVRGGENEHNLMLLDGVPVYIPYHFLGLFSVYNSSILNTAKFLKGSFPARYGGRLSSVFDIRTREGNQYEWHGEISQNLVTTNLMVEGPLKKEKSSILLATRMAPRGYMLEPIMERVYFPGKNGSITTSFFDLNLKLNYKMSDQDRLYLSIYSGIDIFTQESDFDSDEGREESNQDYRWDNTVGALRWNHLFSEKLFSNTTFNFSLYNYSYSAFDKFENSSNSEDEFYFLDSRSHNWDIGLKTDFDYLPNATHAFRFGAGVNGHRFHPSYSYLQAGNELVNNIDSFEFDDLKLLTSGIYYTAIDLYGYAEDRIRISPKLTINPGLRMTTFINSGQTYANVEPRVLMEYKISPKLLWHVSGSRMVQYLHLISNVALRLPNDVWLPSDQTLAPQKSWQVETGIDYQPIEQLSIAVDGYYKKLTHLYAFPDDFDYLDSFQLNDPGLHLLEGEGNAYGAELAVNYNGKTNGGMLSYAIAKSDRIYARINDGESFPYDYDQRHQFKLFFYQQLGKKFQLSASFTYNSANPRINLIGIENGEGLSNMDPDDDDDKNEKRAEAYHRLDLSCTYQTVGKRASHRLKFGVYNLYNRNNVAFYEIDFRSGGSGPRTKRVNALPILPTLGYTVSF